MQGKIYEIKRIKSKDICRNIVCMVVSKMKISIKEEYMIIFLIKIN